MTQPDNTIIIHGDIFGSDAEVLVNPINTVGVMGAGLAKEFARIYGSAYLKDYKIACERRLVCASEGTPHIWTDPESGKVIYGLATKEHWREPSQYVYVFNGLRYLGKFCEDHGHRSVAVPALGCGLGNLNFDPVLKLIEWAALCTPAITWQIYIK